MDEADSWRQLQQDQQAEAEEAAARAEAATRASVEQERQLLWQQQQAESAAARASEEEDNQLAQKLAEQLQAPHQSGRSHQLQPPEGSSSAYSQEDARDSVYAKELEREHVRLMEGKEAREARQLEQKVFGHLAGATVCATCICAYEAIY